jgi:hypothetical protein
MPRRTPIAVLAAVIAATSLAAPTAAYASGTPEQVAWVRRAAERFISAEQSANGSEMCAVLAAPLRATVAGRTCEQRWHSRLVTELRDPVARAHLRADRHAAPAAHVEVRGNHATIVLPNPLLNGSSHFLWTEMCWMLTR